MNSSVNKIGRIVIKTTNEIVDFVVLTIILLLVAVAVYGIWDSRQVYQAADAVQYKIYKPGQQEGSVSFAELQDVNPEVIGWLDVYGTNIDYPITQANDNGKYVNTNAFGDYSLSGAIFLDYQNSKYFQDFNSILYGHHMEKQMMFGELELFGDKEFFDSHLFGNLYYDRKDHGLEFFAFLKTDAYDNVIFAPRIEKKEEQQTYLHKLFEKAVYIRNIGVTTEDRILLLTTCSTESTNGRDILAARITDESFNNPLIGEAPVQTNVTASVDPQDSLAGLFSLKLILGVVLLMLLVLVICHRIKKRQD